MRETVAKLVFATAICLFVFGGSRLSAETVSYSTTIAASDGAGHDSLPTSASFTLPEFNPALGTLTGITIKFALSYQGEVDIYNFSGSSQTATASSSAPIDITAPTSGVPYLTASYSVSNAAITSTPALNEFLGAVSNTTLTFTPSASNLTAYEGLGNSDYQLSYGAGTYSGSTSAPGGTVFVGGDANAKGTASVIYDFIPVPEPASIGLFTTGILSLCGLRRRQRRN